MVDGRYQPLADAASCLGICLAFSIVLYKLIEVPSKSILLAIYDRQYAKSWGLAKSSLFKFVSGPSGLVTAVLLVASCLPLFWRADSDALKSEWAKIIAKTDVGQREVDFGGEVRLLGYEIQHRPSGVNLVMVWMKTNPQTRIRFVHVRDNQGNVVGHGRRNHQLFMNQDVGSVFMEHVFLKHVYLRNRAAPTGAD
jgi:hypothetical protein